MPLPASWVDALFGRLTLRYGTAFSRQYEGLDMDAVKTDWADVLHGTSGDAIAYALRYVSSDRPPTAMAFRDLCRRAPTPAVAALPAPTPNADASLVAEIVGRVLKREPTKETPAEQVYANLRRIAANRGGKWSAAQRQQVRAMHQAGLIDASQEAFIGQEEVSHAG